MTIRPERSANPSIKELLEALSAEERNEAAAARQPSAHGMRPHSHAPTAPAHGSRGRPGNGAYAFARPDSMGTEAIIPAADFEFEQGGGASRSSFGIAAPHAQVPRHAAAPSPSPFLSTGAQEADWQANARARPTPPSSRMRIDHGQTQHQPAARRRLTALARHTLTAAGAIAIVLPSALYLASPMLDRVQQASTVATPAAVIAQRGVAVSAIEPPKATISANPPSATLGAPAGASLSAGRTQALLERGKVLSAARDITAARLFFVRAAEAGSTEGALAAARTYDPAELTSQGILGVQGDVALARKYYEMAAAGGAPGAQERLDRLKQP